MTTNTFQPKPPNVELSVPGWDIQPLDEPGNVFTHKLDFPNGFRLLFGIQPTMDWMAEALDAALEDEEEFQAAMDEMARGYEKYDIRPGLWLAALEYPLPAGLYDEYGDDTIEVSVEGLTDEDNTRFNLEPATMQGFLEQVARLPKAVVLNDLDGE